MNTNISEAARFTKRPVTIEAMKFDGSAKSASAICQWANAGDDAAGHDDPTVSYTTTDDDDAAHDMVVWTLEDAMSASPGDWIIKGVKGEFYPCKPDIFELTYSPHLQGEAVPVAYIEHSADKLSQMTMTLEGLSLGVGRHPVFAHPQPAELAEQQGVTDARDRAADRARFPDREFNHWLDEAITENGEFTIWDQIVDTCSAWHGWVNARDHFTAKDVHEDLGLDEQQRAGNLPRPLEDLRDATQHVIDCADGGDDYACGRPMIEAMATLGIMEKTGRGLWSTNVQVAHAVLAALAATVKQSLQVGEAQGSREQFEAWRGSLPKQVVQCDDHSYTMPAYVDAWDAWQAALASRQPVGNAEQLDRALGETIGQRDRYHEVADDLAGHIERITGVEIGEHSSDNCPWQNAIEAAESYTPAQGIDLAENLLSVLIEEGVLSRNGRVFQKLRALIDGRDAGAGVGS